MDYDNFQDDLAYQLAVHREDIPLFQSPTLSQLTEPDVYELVEQLHNGKPFILAYTRYPRGHGKYLIENQQQLGRILRLQNDFPDVNFGAHCEVRSFIETPSDHDTSYRLDVSPTGKVLAAALIYSKHTEDSRPIIVRDRWDDVEKDTDIYFVKTHFEDPDSPYFLNARSPRSNISAGGNLIPLMGPGSEEPLFPHQMDILETHDINPRAPEVPKDLIEHASFIGEKTGRHLHPLLGIDFLRPYVTDINPGPGNRVFAECWNTGTNPKHNVVAHRLAALASIAEFHQS